MSDQAVDYAGLLAALKGLHGGRERNAVANLANSASFLWEALKQSPSQHSSINWLGFYLASGDDDVPAWAAEEGAGSDDSLVASGANLVLGPFQGRWACTRIGKGRGVCGRAASLKQTVLVPNVHDFPGHIACDSRSQSEIVVPLLHPHDGRLLGVLDIDSAELNTFSSHDDEGLTAICQWLVSISDW